MHITRKIGLLTLLLQFASHGTCFTSQPTGIPKISCNIQTDWGKKSTSSASINLKMSTNVKVIVSEDDFRKALDIRKKVFIDEQKVAESDEIDEFDSNPSAAIHFLALKDGKPAATARVRFLNDGTRAKIQRVATLVEFRRQGIGHSLMRYITDHVRTHHKPPVQELYLEAQVHAIEFYQKLGFEPFGDEFLDVGIPHRAMRLPA